MKYFSVFILTVMLVAPVQPVLAYIGIGSGYADLIIANMEAATSVEYRLDAQVFAEQISTGETRLALDASLVGAAKDLKSATPSTRISGFFRSNIEGEQTAMGGHVLVSPETAYFMNDADQQWYHIDIPEVPEYSSIEERVAEYSEQINNDKTRFLQAFRITGRLPAREVRGVTMSRYSYEVSAQRAIDLMRLSGDFSEDDLNEMLTYFHEHVDVHGELWIDTEQLVPYRITMQGSVVDEVADFRGKAVVNITFMSFNKPVEIRTPAESIDLLAQLAQEEQRYLDDDQDGLLNSQEEHYGTNPQNPDSDGDGYPDGIEVQYGYDPLGPGRLMLE